LEASSVSETNNEEHGRRGPFCQCLLFAAGFSEAQTTPTPVVAAISLEKSLITQHEPALLELRFENLSERGTVVSLGENDEKLELRVVDPEGHAFRKSRPEVRHGFASPDAFSVAGGKMSVGYVPLTDWFDFEKIGTYQIEVSLSPSSLEKERFSYDIRSSPTSLSLTVLPRDERALESICADLLGRTQALHSAGAALSAARALSKVNDPVAVPFLASAMKGNEFKGLMIDALARLKTKEALDALIAASRLDDPETKTLARGALASLGEAGKK
jgi:hypothetical protein